MKRFVFMLMLMFTVSSAFVSCRDQKEDPIEDAADDVGDGLEDAADEVEDAVD